MNKPTEIEVSSEKAIYQGERSVEDLVHMADKIKELQKRLFTGAHVGIIPGTDRPTLLKPGAELICMVFRLAPEYRTTETFDGDHLTVKSSCALRHIDSEKIWGSGEAMCSTKESKYAWRKPSIKCPDCGTESVIKGKKEYGGGWLCWAKKGGCGSKWEDGAAVIENQSTERVPNPDLPDQYNTVLKMANKRSYVDACLKATGASNSYTQDMEDHHAGGGDGRGEATTGAPEGSQTPSSPPAQNGQTNSAPAEKPACPECGQFEMVMPGKEEWGGGWYCWKDKGGCGHAWGKKPKEEAPAADGPTIDRKEANAMTAHAKSCDVSPELLREKIKSLTGMEKLSSLTHPQRDLVIAWIDRGAPPVGDEPATKAQLDEIDKIGAEIEDMQLDSPDGVKSLGVHLREMDFKISTLTQAEANRLITALKVPF